jgi:hypothetical protein
MRGFEQFENQEIAPEKGNKDLWDEVKKLIEKQIEKKTGVEVKIDTPVMHAKEEGGAEQHAAEAGGAEQKEQQEKKGLVEKILEKPKAVRAGAAVTLAALATWTEFWLKVADTTPDFLKSEEEKAQDEKIRRRGWFGIFVDRARKYYKFGGKLEDAVLRGKWDELMEEETEGGSGNKTPEGEAA